RSSPVPHRPPPPFPPRRSSDLAVLRFVLVTLPLAAPGVAAGAILGFAKALGEFGATITFVAAIPGETLTLPSSIYGAVQTPGAEDRKSTRLNSSHVKISYAVFC